MVWSVSLGDPPATNFSPPRTKPWAVLRRRLLSSSLLMKTCCRPRCGRSIPTLVRTHHSVPPSLDSSYISERRGCSARRTTTTTQQHSCHCGTLLSNASWTARRVPCSDSRVHQHQCTVTFEDDDEVSGTINGSAGTGTPASAMTPCATRPVTIQSTDPEQTSLSPLWTSSTTLLLRQCGEGTSHLAGGYPPRTSSKGGDGEILWSPPGRDLPCLPPFC